MEVMLVAWPSHFISALSTEVHLCGLTNILEGPEQKEGMRGKESMEKTRMRRMLPNVSLLPEQI